MKNKTNSINYTNKSKSTNQNQSKKNFSQKNRPNTWITQKSTNHKWTLFPYFYNETRLVDDIFVKNSYKYIATLNKKQHKLRVSELLKNHSREYLEGLYYFTKKRIGKAMTSFTEALTKNTLPKYLFWLSVCHSKRGKHERALSLVRQAIEIQPNEVGLVFYAAKLSVRMFLKSRQTRFLRRALRLFEHADRLEPNDECLYHRFVLRKYFYELERYSGLDRRKTLTVLYPLILNSKNFTRFLEAYWAKHRVEISAVVDLRSTLNKTPWEGEECEMKSRK